MFNLRSLKALGLALLSVDLCVSDITVSENPHVEIDGKLIPDHIVEDYNKYHDPGRSGNLRKRQVPGAHCRQDNLLEAAHSGPYWTSFCSSFIGAPTSTVFTLVTPTSYVLVRSPFDSD